MLLSAPPLEKSDSQWSPLSSGLVTPSQDSSSLSGYWSAGTTAFQSPGGDPRRRSGRFSVDSSGIYYGHASVNNRWSLGTQLSNVSFTECTLCPLGYGLMCVVPSQVIQCDAEEKEWSSPAEESPVDEEDNIFHPDDEIILDPKESLEAPIKRVHPSLQTYGLIVQGQHRHARTRMAS